MTDEERSAWLSSLREQNPQLAAAVQTLLDEQDMAARERFLESHAPLPAPTALAGQFVGPYRLVSPIGQGGMGTVWLAERSDGRFERSVAVKLMNVALLNRAGEERFEREGKILGRLLHPHIAELIDAGVFSNGQPYLVLEHVDGEHIDQYCDSRKLDIESRIRLFLDVLAAVEHAHANLIVHRDLKPSNVLVRTDGCVKLLDFGIAKLLEQEEHTGSATVLTREGGVALTPQYAAPEQVTNQPVTTATDVYALGVLLYLLLTGQHPAGPGPHSPADLVKSIVDTVPSPMSEVATADKVRRLLRGDLDTIVAKALKKNPQERYTTASALADDLRRYLKHEPISARPDTIAYRTSRFVRRNRTAVALATLAFAAAIAGLVGTTIQARTARMQRDFAFSQLSRAEAVIDLNWFLLTDAASVDAPITVYELLERAEKMVRQSHQNEANRVALLISIGEQYVDKVDERARSVLEQAYSASRALSDRSTRARASCALAIPLTRGADTPRAEALVQEGLRELSDEPHLTFDRIFCLMSANKIAREKGSAQQSVVIAQEAQRLLKESPLGTEFHEVEILDHLADSYRRAGRYGDAAAAFQEASLKLAALGRGETQTAAALYNNWALMLLQTGQPLEADKLLSRAISLEGEVSFVLANRAHALRDQGQLLEAAEYSERARVKARHSGDELSLNKSLLFGADVQRRLGNLKRAAEMFSEVELWMRRALPAGHAGFASLLSAQAMLAQAQGNSVKAMDLANQAVAVAEAAIKAGREGGHYLQLSLLRRSDIELQLGRASEAASDAVRGLELLQKLVQSGTFSCDIGRAELTRAQALRALGKHDEARAALLAAAEHLEHTLGPDHPETRSARQLAK